MAFNAEAAYQRLDDIIDRLITAQEKQSEIVLKQAEIQLQQTIEVKLLQDRQAEHGRSMQEHEEVRKQIELNLKEISDKLNGLIGYIDNLPRGGKTPPQQ